MPDSASNVADNFAGALAVYEAFVRQRGGDVAKCFDALCREHPQLASDLKKFHAVFQLAQAAANSRSLHQSMRELFGEDAEVKLTLDEVDAASEDDQATVVASFGVPPSGGPGGEPAEAGTPSRADRYALEGEVARGGMGIIYKVRDRELNRTLAMKVMLGGHSFSNRMVKGGRSPGEGSPTTAPTSNPLFARFLEEVQVTAQLDHPGIVAVHELGLDAAGRPYFTMKLVKGRELGRIFELARAEQEDWNLPRAVGALIKACQAVAFAHSKGVIHRDLKPANVMVGRFGEVYVMDWGLAKVTGRKDLHDIRVAPDSRISVSEIQTPRVANGSTAADSPLITMDGSVVGTPAYMPPEQARGQVELVDAVSDIYSLGAILYNLLTGQAPYVEPGARISPHTILARVLDGPPKRVHQFNPQAPPELIAICEKAMAREKRDRYASSLGLAEDLQAYLDHRVVRAYRTGAVAEFKSWVKRNRGLAAASLGAMILAVGFSLAFAVRERAVAAKERQRALELKENLARQYLYRGDALCQDGDVARGLHWLARSLREAPEPYTGLKDAIREHLAFWTQGWHSPKQMLMSEHGLKATALSPDGKMAATGDNRGRVQLWSVGTGEPLPLTLRHDGVIGIAFSPDSKRVVTIGSGLARIWLAERGTRVGEDIHHEKAIRAIFSPDGTRLLTHGHEKEETTVRLWNAATGKLIAPPMKHLDRLWDAAFSPDGARILTACGDWKARLWSSETGLQLGAAMQHGNEVVAVAFSPNGKLAVTASQDWTAQLWDASTGMAVGLRMIHSRELWTASFSPDGRWVLTGSLDKTARLWNGTNGEPAQIVFDHKAPIKHAGFSADGKWLFTAGGRKVRLWSTKDHQLLGEPMHLEDEISSVHLGGQTLLTGSQPRALLWSADDASRRVVSLFSKAPPYGDLTPEILAFGGDGKRLFMGDHVGWTWWWLPDTGEASQSPFRHDKRLQTLAASRDNKHFLTGSTDGEARLWSVEGGERPLKKFVHANSVGALAFSSNGTFAATASETNVMVWSVDSGREVGKPLPHPQKVNSVAFSPDAKILATACDDGFARLWSLTTGKVATQIAAHSDSATVIAFSADGKLLATGSRDKTARIWNALTGEATDVILEHMDVVSDVCFSPDGRFLATAADDHLRFWSSKTGELLFPPIYVCCELNDLDFSPDGKRIAAGGNNVFPTVWKVPQPFHGDARQAELLVQVLTRQEMDNHGVLTWLDRATWKTRKEQLEKPGGPVLK